MSKSANNAYFSKHVRRRDQNHGEFKRALQNEGLQVIDTDGQGNGFPDQLVNSPDDPDRPVLVEIKVPGEGLTPKELYFFATYLGRAVWADDPQEIIAMFEREKR